MVAIVALDTLDGPRLADALRAGIYRLFTRTDHLNRINVFPVPDGDTGTNMSMTMSAVLSSLDRSRTDHAGEVLVRVADAAIDGARGNSGAILAQFLLGLADRAGHLAALSTHDFAAAIAGGARYAREALTEPREGTLLTVLTDVGRELERLAGAESVRDFRALVRRALPRARESLDGTRGQLEVLRSAGVVDAGAQGFVDLLEGIDGYLETGAVGEAIAPLVHGEEAMAVGGTEGEHRYCTECVVTGEAIDQRALRERLSALGSSLVVAGTHRKIRIHVHTNDPEFVFELGARHGIVSSQKADDMHAQALAAHHARGRRVAVVTDSAADVPDEFLERLEIQLVPVRVHFGARSYLDKVSLSPEEFYRELRENPDHPKTSQPPPGDFRRMYEFLCSHFEHVVSIQISAKVSGTFGAARSAAERVSAERVRVIDSGNASLGQGLVAIHAAERAQAGLGIAEVEAAVRDAVRSTRTFALLANLDYAVRGGRIPSGVRTLSRWLRFAPVITNHADGRIGFGGAVWGRNDLRSRFARFVRRRMLPGARWRVAVGHGDAEGEARLLLAELVDGADNVESSYLTPLGSALGVHGGPGMLVVGLQELATPAAHVAVTS
jgi:hypothetical protein